MQALCLSRKKTGSPVASLDGHQSIWSYVTLFTRIIMVWSEYLYSDKILKYGIGGGFQEVIKS
jgi:hypothetical protein